MGKMEEELDKDDVCHRFYLTYATREALEGFGDFRVRGKVIRTFNMHMTLC